MYCSQNFSANCPTNGATTPNPAWAAATRAAALIIFSRSVCGSSTAWRAVTAVSRSARPGEGARSRHRLSTAAWADVSSRVSRKAAITASSALETARSFPVFGFQTAASLSVALSRSSLTSTCGWSSRRACGWPGRRPRGLAGRGRQKSRNWFGFWPSGGSRGTCPGKSEYTGACRGKSEYTGEGAGCGTRVDRIGDRRGGTEAIRLPGVPASLISAKRPRSTVRSVRGPAAVLTRHTR